jgi:sugar lactone lactonase YvrE
MPRLGGLAGPLAGLFAAVVRGSGKMVPAGARVEKVAEGCNFTEGPAVDAQGNVYFSDCPNNRIMVLPVNGRMQVWKTGTRGANGMLFDREGRLVTCNSQLAPDGRSVTRYERDGKITVLAERYNGKRLNSPNDLAIDRQGRIYFTDPRYGAAADLEQDRMAVYRIERDGKLARVIDDLQVPNGILITPDGKTLYVADNSPAADGNRTLVAYDIDRKGAVKRRAVLYDFKDGRGIDGMVLDEDGNIWATAGEEDKTGVYVISPEGRKIGFVPTPETATNCTFGGPDLKTLYITAGKSLYRIRTDVAGQVLYPSRSQAARPPKQEPKVAVTEGPALPPGAELLVRGVSAGGYAAFPDVTRTADGELFCVFYSGYAHISPPKAGDAEWRWGGRIMAIHSDDEGRTWSTPTVIVDTPHDDRDPHVSAMSDGTLVLSWFQTWNPAEEPKGDSHRHRVFVSTSINEGRTWSEPHRVLPGSERWWAASAPVRELKDGSWILGLYHQEADNHAWGATVKSYDRGKTWTDLADIGREANLPLDAETDVVQLQDGSLLAALRSSRVNLHFSSSADGGKTWSAVRDSGFKGHCPLFLRLKDDTLLLAHRVPNTSLHWSRDEGRTWHGPLQIDGVIGAYPGLVQLRDGDVLCVYYEEGAGSGIRARRLRVTKQSVALREAPAGRG